MSTAVAAKGLEGVVATTSGICWIDGDTGVLAYRGIDIHELAEKSTFEETAYLLWFGRLPTQPELAISNDARGGRASSTPKMIELLRSFPTGRDTHGSSAHRRFRSELL